jgi:hypothetical protein
MKNPSVREYVVHVLLNDWPSLMSGGMSAPFACASLYVSNGYAKVLFGALAIVAVIAAGFRIWAKEREDHLKTYSDLKNELHKKGQPRVIVALNNDDWGRLLFVSRTTLIHPHSIFGLKIFGEGKKSSPMKLLHIGITWFQP